jgi:hypothetical protein
VEPDAVHRRILDSTPLCVFAGLNEPEADGEPEPTVTDDLEEVTCRECKRFEVD